MEVQSGDSLDRVSIADGSHRGVLTKVPLVVIASDPPPAESAANSYRMSPNALRLPRRPPRRTPRNDGSRGFSTSPKLWGARRKSALRGRQTSPSASCHVTEVSARDG